MEITAPCSAGVPPAFFGVPPNRREPLQAGRLRYIGEPMHCGGSNARFLCAPRDFVAEVELSCPGVGAGDRP